MESIAPQGPWRFHYVIAWRKTFEARGKEGKPLAASTTRRKLSALSSLFEYLSVTHNPIKANLTP